VYEQKIKSMHKELTTTKKDLKELKQAVESDYVLKSTKEAVEEDLVETREKLAKIVESNRYFTLVYFMN